MRIIHVAGDLGLGGIERVVQRLARAQRGAGWDVGVITTRGGGRVANELLEEGIPVTDLGLGERGGWAAVPTMVRELRRHRPFLLHAHGVVGPAGRLAGRLAGARAVVQHLHGTDRYGRGRRIFEQLFPANAYLAISRAVADDFERQTGRRPEVLGNPVDTQLYRWTPESYERGLRLLDVGDETEVVVTMGRFVPSKAQGVLVSAMPAVLAQHPGALFVFIGDGPLRPEIEEAARRLGANARFLGAQDDPVPFLCAAAVYVQPSVDREGAGLAVLEAMACKRSVVATTVEGLPEAVGEDGVLVPPRAPEALAQAVNALLDDAPRRARLGARAREHVERDFSVDVVARRLEEIYARLGARR